MWNKLVLYGIVCMLCHFMEMFQEKKKLSGEKMDFHSYVTQMIFISNFPSDTTDDRPHDDQTTNLLLHIFFIDS